MHRNFANLLIFLARLAQIACGALIFSFALAASKRFTDLGYAHDLAFGTIFLGAGVGVFGVFGLFGCKRDVNEPEEVRLSMLILFIDCMALLTCFGAGIMMTVQGTNWESQYGSDVGLLYIPAVFAYVCGGFVILPLMVRTASLWWKVLLQRVPTHLTVDKQIDHEAASTHTCCHQHHHQDHELAYTQPSEARRSYQTDAAKSTFSSRPHSVISGADTLTYPNIDNVAQSGVPTRAPSHAAPSYTSRVEVGSKVNQS